MKWKIILKFLKYFYSIDNFIDYYKMMFVRVQTYKGTVTDWNKNNQQWCLSQSCSPRKKIIVQLLMKIKLPLHLKMPTSLLYSSM